jgi:hypothetical protein
MEAARWSGRAVFGMAVVLAVVCGEASAAWRVAGQIGGPITAVAVAGDTAYIGVGTRVLVYDLSNPASPREIGSTPGLGDLVLGVFVSGGRAYVAAGTTGVHVFDISDATNPRLIGRWDSPGSAEAVAVVETVAYVADGPFGLQIVDFSNLDAPAPRGAAFDMRFAFDVVVEGSYAFIAAAGSGLLVADIADPSRPRELATLDTPGFARALAVSGASLYLADQWGGLRVYDISDPERPRATAAIEMPSWAFDVAVTASTVLVADGSMGLRVFAAADAQGGELASYAIPGQLSWKVAVSGDRVLVAARGLGVHVLDARTPPRLLSVIAPVSNAQAVVARDNLAFLATGDQGLRIVDLSDPARPVERGRGEGGRGWAILVDDTRAYICDGMPGDHRIRVFNITDADRPSAVTTFGLAEGICRDLVRDGTWLYVPNEFGLEVFDVSNRDAPARVGAIRLPGSGVDATAGAVSIALAGTTAFVPNAIHGITTIDISDPRNPRVIGGWSSTDPPVHVFDVDVQGGFAFVGSGLPTPELIVLDARDPARPVRTGAALLPEPGNQVIVRGTLAYVAAGASGVVVFDIGNPAAPREVERIATPGYANHLSFAGSRLLVAAGDGGLYVLEPASAGPTSLRLTSNRRSGNREPIATAAAATDRGAITRDVPVRSGPSAAGRQVVITSTADSGAGTLREALTNLQTDDVITFDPAVFLPGNPVRIRPSSVLPAINRDGITIDASNAGVILDGSALSGQPSGLTIQSSGNAIKGLQIVDFPNCGILIGGNGANVIGGDRSRGTGPSGEGNVISRNQTAGIRVLGLNGNRIVGNRIGTDTTGRTGLGRQERGVWIFSQLSSASGDWIGGHEPWEANVIAGNVLAEVYLQNTRGHRVVGNYLGTDPSGTIRVGDAHTGLSTTVAADNVISGNVISARQSAVWIVDAGSTCNQISGNWIGVTKGSVPIVRDSQASGVQILESFNLVSNNAIGGVQYGGLTVSGYQSVATETVIIGNRIGTGLGGPRPERLGIRLGATSRTFIGGPTDAERNFAIGNELGLWFTAGVDRTFVMGNSIGVDGAGRPFRNTGDGLDLGPATLSFVQGNVIAENGGRGVAMAGPRNRLRRNSIFGNREGIAVTGGGGPAPPILQSVSGSTVTGTACPNCAIEIYSDEREQGRTYEGSAIADASGRFSFTRDGSLRGPGITALATDAAGSTSAFSAPQRGGSASREVGPSRAQDATSVRAPAVAVATVTHSGPNAEPVMAPADLERLRVSGEAWLPYFVSGAGMSSSFILINPSNAAASVEIEFFDFRGEPFELDLGGRRPSSRFAVALPAYGSVTIATDGAGERTAGSARVTARSLSIAAAVTFGSVDHDWISVGPSRADSVAVIPIARSVAAGMSTFVAIVSTGAPATITLTLTDAAGRPLGGDETVVLPAHKQLAARVEHLLRSVDGEFEGRLLITADARAFAATGVRVKSPD